MADTIWAAFSFGNAAISVSAGDDEFSDGRNSLYRSTGTPAAAGHGAALVVQEPLPRLARTATMPRLHEIVSRDF
ncbi:hypothetical protein KIP88_11125 [Bradyrhizobium sp. SRL28]|uniref:hypothetical protein n=1 Tax=Bradyrhizobium sp. SRL28 TaxID=2836178 RepID=UPI001BDDCF12|nr:hypothetical protein [Bradyrhizobium sp. SRL28]MBT1511057.1 hypothetical protein [Bradyrhizobium sp. SRL28]